MLVIFVLLGGIGSYAYATEIKFEPYLKIGTIAWDELGGIGDHKSMVAGV